jgi:hypothetical protein
MVNDESAYHLTTTHLHLMAKRWIVLSRPELDGSLAVHETLSVTEHVHYAKKEEIPCRRILSVGHPHIHL